MEALIEILLEIFSELIITVIANAIGAFVVAVDADPKMKRILKYIFTYSILILTIVLIAMSLIHSKESLAVIAISYMLLVLLLRTIKRFNDDKMNSKVISILISIFRRVIHYSYPILLIIFSAVVFLTNKALKIINNIG